MINIFETKSFLITQLMGYIDESLDKLRLYNKKGKIYFEEQ